MNGAVHLIGGVTAAVVLGTTSPLELTTVAVASLVPDIDRSNSLMGRFIPILPGMLERLLGKRTLTHSFLFASSLALLIHFINPSLIWAFNLGIMSHLLLDLLSGYVRLLWPLPKMFTLTFGVPPIWMETVFIVLWTVWLFSGGYQYFVSVI